MSNYVMIATIAGRNHSLASPVDFLTIQQNLYEISSRRTNQLDYIKTFLVLLTMLLMKLKLVNWVAE